MTEIHMKMAKASEADLDMAIKLQEAIDSLSGEYCPCLPDEIAQFRPGDDYEPFDRDNDEQCGRAMRHILDIFQEGSLLRVVWGMSVLLDPKNEVVDPNSDTLELHPKFRKPTP